MNMFFGKKLSSLLSPLAAALALSFSPLLAHAQDAGRAASKVEVIGDSASLKIDRILVKEDGLLQIQADVYNDYRKQITVFYRFKWLDDSGFSVWEDEAWKPFVIQSQAANSIRATAPTKKATDFKIQLRASDARSAPRDQPNNNNYDNPN